MIRIWNFGCASIYVHMYVFEIGNFFFLASSSDATAISGLSHSFYVPSGSLQTRPGIIRLIRAELSDCCL